MARRAASAAESRRTVSARAAATATATSAVSCSAASSQWVSGRGLSRSRLRERSARSSADTLAAWPASTASTSRSRKRRRSEAGPANSWSIAGTSQITRKWSANAAADPAGSRSMRYLRTGAASAFAGGSMPVPSVARPSAPSTSAETAQEPSPSLKASSLMSARRSPRPGENSEIASRRFVLPAPFGPTSTTRSPPTAIFAAW